LLPPGWIDGATIREAVERPSARGNDMIEVVIAVPDGRGSERLFKDWLSSMPLGALRLRHACESVGKLDRYNSGDRVSRFRPVCSPPIVAGFAILGLGSSRWLRHIGPRIGPITAQRDSKNDSCHARTSKQRSARHPSRSESSLGGGDGRSPVPLWLR
jgi:hypothetical protein